MSIQAIALALKVQGLNPSEKLLLLALANYADDSMKCWPSHRALAADASLSQRTILRTFKRLEEIGLLTRSPRTRADGSRSSDMIVLKMGADTVSPRGDRLSVGVGTQCHGGGDTVSPLTTFEPSTEPSIEPASLSPTPTKAIYPEDFEAAWKLYPHHTRRSSKPDSLAQWRKLSPAERLSLPAACARYRRLGAEPKGECGAPAMERWLKRGLHLNWTDDGEPVAAEGPADAAVVARRLRHYRDTGAWEPTWGDRPTNDTGREQAA